MSGRWMAVSFPAWPLQRWAAAARRGGAPNEEEGADATFDPLASPQRPFALTVERRGVETLLTANGAARRLGLEASMRLADARAAAPDLRAAPADLAADRRALEALARWAGRYSPSVAVDGEDGLVLDIRGCAHLFGGERRMLLDMERRLGAFGLVARVAIGAKRATAWAWARCGRRLGEPPDQGVLPSDPKALEAALAPLPTRALNITRDLEADLAQLGLRKIGDLAALRGAPLLRRFEAALDERLGAMLGDLDEPPIASAKEPAVYVVRTSWAEPIGSSEMILAALAEALARLAHELERAQLGARLLRLALHRLDGEAVELEAATSAPMREPSHLAKLLTQKLEALDLGFGVELMLLEAVRVQRFPQSQAELAEIDERGGDLAAGAKALDDLKRLEARKKARRAS